MTEGEAKHWLATRYDVDNVTRLEAFVSILKAGAKEQNLVAPSTLSTVWARHIVDSAQLMDWAPDRWSHWIDIGSGAGLPGIVIAVLSGRCVTLIEPRKLRAGFLDRCRDMLELADVTVIAAKAENVTDTHADVVSARAVADLDTVFDMSRHLSNSATTFILPKGASAVSEMALARQSWHGTFHVEQSIVDPASGIVVATGLSRR